MDVYSFVEKLKENIRQNRQRVSFIGVAGGSASGKSSITEIIKRYFTELKTVSVVNVDLFYKDLTPEISQRFNGKINWDDPFMIDEQELINCIDKLRDKEKVVIKKYDYALSRHIDEDIIIEPADIIIVEGIFSYYWKSTRDLFKLRIFVDCCGEFRLMRRIIRDVKERGRTVEGVIEQYATFVKPSYDKYIVTQKNYAHLVLPWENMGNSTNLEAVELLINYISVLAGQNSRPETPRNEKVIM